MLVNKVRENAGILISFLASFLRIPLENIADYRVTMGTTLGLIGDLICVLQATLIFLRELFMFHLWYIFRNYLTFINNKELLLFSQKKKKIS